MSQTILITGGTGIIGRRLTQLLLERGYQVSFLSRSIQSVPNVTVYQWDIDEGHLDVRALVTADHIIHLAGAAIADQRWTHARKKEILDSRTKSTSLLANYLRRLPHNVKSFISASGIGYYGMDSGDQPMTETSPAGNDFLAQVTQAWEHAVDEIASLGIRTVKFRTGVVLTMKGGALPRLARPIKLGMGASIGSGQQYVSWIHVDDLCQMYREAITDERWEGIYNAVAPGSVTNETLTRQIAEVLHRPLFLPTIPAVAIKLIFGELAMAVLGSSCVLNKRIQEETDFQYQFGNLKDALKDTLL